jgi:hypothetical protein
MIYRHWFFNFLENKFTPLASPPPPPRKPRKPVEIRMKEDAANFDFC